MTNEQTLWSLHAEYLCRVIIEWLMVIQGIGFICIFGRILWDLLFNY